LSGPQEDLCDWRRGSNAYLDQGHAVHPGGPDRAGSSDVCPRGVRWQVWLDQRRPWARRAVRARTAPPRRLAADRAEKAGYALMIDGGLQAIDERDLCRLEPATRFYAI